jgi:hypothetical protein
MASNAVYAFRHAESKTGQGDASSLASIRRRTSACLEATAKEVGQVITSDICWLAGLLEGEGAFHPGCSNIHISVDMTDRDVVSRVADLMRAKLYGPYSNGPLGRKPRWRVRVTGPKAAGWMMTLYSQLGERRRARIRELLADWKTKRSGAKNKLMCLNGHPLSGTNLLDTNDNKRRCKTCARDQMANFRARRCLLDHLIGHCA